MDAFYAAVEQRDRPELRGQPVIVGADPQGGRGRGVVATASYEARRFGVGSAMPISQAWKACPQGVYVRPDMAKYAAVSAQVFEILRRFTDQVEPVSIDEAFLDVTSSLKAVGPGGAPPAATAEALARRLKDAVLAGTGLAGILGQLPGSEPRPYIIRFTEDRPNPLYRRICYTLAWSEVVSYAVLNSAGIIHALVTDTWRMRAFYDAGYLPIAVTMWVLGALGWLPRVRRSTKGEGTERRYFYGSVWAVCIAQPFLWLPWGMLPMTRVGTALKLILFWAALAAFGTVGALLALAVGVV